MKKKVIFDANIWISFFNVLDSKHEDAAFIFENHLDIIVIPEYVVSEICTVLRIRYGKDLSDQFIDLILESDHVEILASSEDFFRGTLVEFRGLEDDKLSFVDMALLFLSSEYKVVTFDKDLHKRIEQ